MSKPTTQVLVYFTDTATASSRFTLNDDVRGELDSIYTLSGDTGTDIAGDAFMTSVRRGRPSQFFDEFDAGTATVGLNNMDRDYDPLYVAGPWYGDLRPGKRIQVITEGVVIYEGKVADWDLSYEVGGRSSAMLRSEDALATLGRTYFNAWTATASQLAGARLNAAISRSEVNWSGGARDFDLGISLLQGDSVTWGSNVLNYCQLVAGSDLGAFFASRNNLLTFRDRHSNMLGSPTVTFGDPHASAAYLSLDGIAGSYATTPDSTALDLTGSFEIVARCAATDWMNGTNQRIFSKMNGAGLAAGGGFEMYTSAAGGPAIQWSDGVSSQGVATTPALLNGSTYWLRATYDSGTLTGTVYYAGDSESEPSSWTSAGSVVGTGSPSANSIVGTIGGMTGLSREFTGKIYRVIVRNAVSGGTTVFDSNFDTATASGQTTITEQSTNRATVTVAGSAAIVVTDGVMFNQVEVSFGSETFYQRVSVDREGGTVQSYSATTATDDGIRTLKKTGVLLNTDADALALAQYLATTYATGEARVATIGVTLDDTLQTADELAALLALEINSLISVRWTPNGVGDAIQQALVVQGIEHNIAVDRHDLVLSLGKYDGRAPFILDDALLGELDVAALTF